MSSAKVHHRHASGGGGGAKRSASTQHTTTTTTTTKRVKNTLTPLQAMKRKTHFARLELRDDCTVEEVNKSYRKLVLQYHPDKIKNKPNHDELVEIFKLITESRNVLADATRRLKYENELHAESAANAAAANNNNPYGGSFQQSTKDFEQFLRQQRDNAGRKYNGTSTRSAGLKPRARRFNLNVTLEQIDKSGIVQHTYNKIINNQVCPRTQIVCVKVPYGALDGQNIKIEGAGDEEPGKEPGDLLFFVRTKKHTVFHKRMGDDLYMTQLVTPLQLINGCVVRFRSVYGQLVESPIAGPIRHNSKYRLRGFGMRRAKGATGEPDDERGDVIVTLKLDDDWPNKNNT